MVAERERGRERHQSEIEIEREGGRGRERERKRNRESNVGRFIPILQLLLPILMSSCLFSQEFVEELSRHVCDDVIGTTSRDGKIVL